MNNIEYSSTGVNNIKPDKAQHGLIFSNEICPYCGANLVLDSKQLKQNIVKVRYVCLQCNFVCPIYHDIKTDTTSPVYDSSIKDFIDNFGKIRGKEK